MPTRRQVLATGLLGGAALAVGGLGLGLQRTVSHAPRAPLQALTPRQFSVLWAVAERVAPGAHGFPRASDVGVAEGVDTVLARAHPGFARDVGRALLLFENGIVHAALGAGTRPFSACPPDEQDLRLRAWMTSDRALQRTVFQALNGLCTAVYFASPEVEAHVGYPGPPTVEESGGG